MVKKICILIGLLVLVIGCGKKTSLVPPKAATPRPINDLSCELGEKGAEFSWTYPVKSVAGVDIDNIRYFRLYKSMASADEYCDDCPVKYVDLLKVEAGNVAPGDTLTVFDPNLTPRHHYTYSVVSWSGWHDSRGSNIVSFWWDQPAAAPAGPRVEVGDGFLALKWQPVTSYHDGSPLVEGALYQVFRQVAGGEMVAVTDKIDEPLFVDQGLVNDRKYSYQVKSFHKLGETLIQGGTSEVVRALPKDRTPPPVPALLSVVRVDEGIKVLWDTVTAPDLAGYRVYRRLLTDDQWQLVGKTGSGAFSFVDLDQKACVQGCRYGVSSVDSSPQTNESAMSPEVVFD